MFPTLLCSAAARYLSIKEGESCFEHPPTEEGESYFDTPSLLRITRLLIFVGELYGELKVGVFFYWLAFSEGVAS